jgi:ribonuclease P protein component
MLDRKHRFHGYSSLKKVYPKTKSVRGSYISLRYANRPVSKPYRVAVVVGKKIHKSAVKRNRIRRRVYEAIRQSDIPESTDLIFNIYSDQVAEIDFKQLSEQINDLLSKVTKT